MNKPIHIPGKRLVITKQMILNSQSQTKSNMEAARWLEISFNTYKKYAKMYDLYEKHKNQAGFGISKSKPTRTKKLKGIDKYYINYKPRYKATLYVLGLTGFEKIAFKNKYQKEFYKIGYTNCVPKRFDDLIGRKALGIPYDESMWKEWFDNLDWIQELSMGSYTIDETVKREAAVHHILKKYKVQNIASTEIFNVSGDKIKKVIRDFNALL